MSVINREDAIKAIVEVVGAMHPYRIPGVIETYSQYNEAWTDTIDKVEQAIEALPDADDGWIPVEERLPEFNKYVLISRKEWSHLTSNDGDKVFKWMRRKDSISGKEIWWCYERGYIADEDVLAWMPLPKPYQPKEDK